MAIPKVPTIRLSPFNYACQLCGKSGYERVYLGPAGEVAAYQKCLREALTLFKAESSSSSGGADG